MEFLKWLLKFLEEREHTGDDSWREERVFEQWYAYSLQLTRA
jgi:hypothetical protein